MVMMNNTQIRWVTRHIAMIWQLDRNHREKTYDELTLLIQKRYSSVFLLNMLETRRVHSLHQTQAQKSKNQGSCCFYDQSANHQAPETNKPSFEIEVRAEKDQCPK